MSNADVLVLAYQNCDSCKKALRWLEEHGVAHRLRPIVEEPPTPAELSRWVPLSTFSIRKWLNTSGQSYRALGRERVEAANDAELAAWLARDGKLVKRPVLVTSTRVLLGYQPEAYAALFPNT